MRTGTATRVAWEPTRLSSSRPPTPRGGVHESSTVLRSSRTITCHRSDVTEDVSTVVCLHSGGFTSRQWRRLREAFGSTHDVLTPDLIGYGASGGWPPGKPFHYQQDVDAIVERIDAVGAPVHLVGHSYGGFLACHVARANPDAVRSLALYEPVTFSVLDPILDVDELTALDELKGPWEPDANGVDEGWLASFVDWWNGPGAWAALPAETAKEFRAVGWKVFQEVTTLAADATGADGFAEIIAPSLLMYGSRSPATEQRTVQRLAEALPESYLRRFEDVGHRAPISHHARVNEAIVEFVRAH